MKHVRGRLLVLIGLAVLLALALPDTAQATSLSEVKKLTASDAQEFDRFGASVAMSGDTAVVGATFEDTAARSAGAAYVFQRGQGGADTWVEVTKLTASDAEFEDRFGWSVSVSGDTAVVGAGGEGAGGQDAGAVYVFERDQGGADNWGEVTKLTASDAQAQDAFGTSVAVSGDTVIVGAFGESAGGAAAGAAYIFQRDQVDADSWGEVRKLTASDAEAEDFFGLSVAVSGNTVFVGAVFEDTAARSAGAAYVYQRDEGGAGNWGEVKKLTASDAGVGGSFGLSLAISGDTAVVGAPGDRVESDDGPTGAAYVFQRDEGGPSNWGEVTKLSASDVQPGDVFGSSVAVSGDTGIVGAVGEDAAGRLAGAAYMVQRDEGGPSNWGEVTKLIASDGRQNDHFGGSVAVRGDIALVGAYWEDSAGSSAGAVYVYSLLQPKLTGDANCDGLVSSIDAALVLQFIAGLLDALACEDTADANGDGNLNSIDAALILQYGAGLLTNL